LTYFIVLEKEKEEGIKIKAKLFTMYLYTEGASILSPIWVIFILKVEKNIFSPLVMDKLWPQFFDQPVTNPSYPFEKKGREKHESLIAHFICNHNKEWLGIHVGVPYSYLFVIVKGLIYNP
jgi:hypothetical protein